MNPSQVATVLRRIAAKIEASKNPDRTLVARDLKRLVAEIVPPAATAGGTGEPKHPSELKEDEFAVYQDPGGGGYRMYHRANGQLFVTESDDPESFDPNDAEPLQDVPAEQYQQGQGPHCDWTTVGQKFVKRGKM